MNWIVNPGYRGTVRWLSFNNGLEPTLYHKRGIVLLWWQVAMLLSELNCLNGCLKT